MDNVKTCLKNLIQCTGTHPFLFVGAGFSRRYMNTEKWDELLKHFCSELGEFRYNAYANRVDEKEYYGQQPKIASLLEAEYNKVVFTEEKYNDFLSAHSEQIKNNVSPLKIAIAEHLAKAAYNADDAEIKMLKKLAARSVSGIITTNYDTLLERIFTGYKAYIGQEDLIFAKLAGLGEIYKIHGSVVKPDSLVLTAEDYKEFENLSSYLIAKLLTIFLEYPVIFIGYSLTDRNVRNILKQIANCLSQSKLDALKDRMVFINFDNCEAVTTRAVEFENGKSIAMTQISTCNFMQIYEAIYEVKSKYSPKVLRQLRRDIYDMAKEDTPNTKIVAADFEQLDELPADVSYVLGVGVKNNGSIVKAEHLYVDAVLGNQYYNPEIVVEEYLPELLKQNSGGLPMYKYLVDYKKTIYGKVKENIIKNKQIEDFLNNAQKHTKKGFRQGLSDISVKGVIAQAGFEEAYKRLYFLNENEIVIDDLKYYLCNFLNKGKSPEAVVKGNSELKRLIRIYDFVKYHSKMPLTTSSNSADT